MNIEYFEDNTWQPALLISDEVYIDDEFDETDATNPNAIRVAKIDVGGYPKIVFLDNVRPAQTIPARCGTYVPMDENKNMQKIARLLYSSDNINIVNGHPIYQLIDSYVVFGRGTRFPYSGFGSFKNNNYLPQLQANMNELYRYTLENTHSGANSFVVYRGAEITIADIERHGYMPYFYPFSTSADLSVAQGFSPGICCLFRIHVRYDDPYVIIFDPTNQRYLRGNDQKEIILMPGFLKIVACSVIGERQLMYDVVYNPISPSTANYIIDSCAESMSDICTVDLSEHLAM
jgi:hypothetical protein